MLIQLPLRSRISSKTIFYQLAIIHSSFVAWLTIKSLPPLHEDEAYLCEMTNSLSERDRKVIWHPYTQHKDILPPIPVTQGKGSLLFDDKGNSYIDAISSWWVNIHGHAHPYIAKRIYEQALQLEHIIFAGFTHEPAVTLAERLLKILPGNLSKIFYSDDGSTSTEVAVKMAIQYWWNEEKPMVNGPLPMEEKTISRTR